MLSTRRFPTFFNRIYDCPGYTIVPAKRRRAGIRVGQVTAALILLTVLALAGGVKTIAGTLVYRARHHAELWYWITPALTVVVVVLAEDTLQFFKEGVL